MTRPSHADHTGPRPYGGVGGTRVGVKCLHAHVAHLLATGDDVVGAWTLDQLGEQPSPHPSNTELSNTEQSGTEPT